MTAVTVRCYLPDGTAALSAIDLPAVPAVGDLIEIQGSDDESEWWQVERRQWVVQVSNGTTRLASVWVWLEESPE